MLATNLAVDGGLSCLVLFPCVPKHSTLLVVPPRFTEIYYFVNFFLSIQVLKTTHGSPLGERFDKRIEERHRYPLHRPRRHQESQFRA